MVIQGASRSPEDDQARGKPLWNEQGKARLRRQRISRQKPLRPYEKEDWEQGLVQSTRSSIIIIIIIFGLPLLLDQKVQRRAFSLQVNPRQSSLSKTSLVSVQERAVHLVTSHLSVFVHLSLLS